MEPGRGPRLPDGLELVVCPDIELPNVRGCGKIQSESLELAVGSVRRVRAHLRILGYRVAQGRTISSRVEVF